MPEIVEPSWLEEPCPPWCRRAHAEDDHPEDRNHQSEPSLFLAVAGTGDGVPVTATLRPTTLTVRMGRYVGERTTWLAIEDSEEPGPRMVLTDSSAWALHQMLAQQLTAS